VPAVEGDGVAFWGHRERHGKAILVQRVNRNVRFTRIVANGRVLPQALLDLLNCVHVVCQLKSLITCRGPIVSSHVLSEPPRGGGQMQWLD